MKSRKNTPSNSVPAIIRTVRGVVPLYEMKEYFEGPIFRYFIELAAWEKIAGRAERNQAADPENIAGICAKLGVLKGLATEYDFRSVASQCERIIAYCEQRQMNVRAGDFRDHLMELRRRAEDELKGNFFLHLTLAEADQFKNPVKGWEDVAVRFPKVRFNIEESGKCHALGRLGASVFHILQVAEYGVIQVADLFGVSGDKPGWGSLQRLKKLQETPYKERQGLELKYSKLLDDVVPLALVVRDSWRHKLDHVDNQIRWMQTDFSPDVADEIIKATRGFMRKLAAELPQQRKLRTVRNSVH